MGEEQRVDPELVHARAHPAEPLSARLVLVGHDRPAAVVPAAVGSLVVVSAVAVVVRVVEEAVVGTEEAAAAAASRAW